MFIRAIRIGIGTVKIINYGEKKMPVKFKKSAKTVARGTKIVTTEHFYMKSMSKKALFEALNDPKTKPKQKQKSQNELVRRGIKIVWGTPNET